VGEEVMLACMTDEDNAASRRVRVRLPRVRVSHTNKAARPMSGAS
jgi:hypothetical protein